MINTYNVQLSSGESITVKANSYLTDGELVHFYNEKATIASYRGWLSISIFGGHVVHVYLNDERVTLDQALTTAASQGKVLALDGSWNKVNGETILGTQLATTLKSQSSTWP